MNSHMPVYFSGSSEATIRIAGEHADVYTLRGKHLWTEMAALSGAGGNSLVAHMPCG